MTKSGFDLDEIERLLAAAAPGEWRVELDMRTAFRHVPEREEYEYIAGYNILGDVEVIGCEGIIPGNHSEHDAALIVALHNYASAMLTEIRELRAENARLGRAFKDMVEEYKTMRSERDKARAALGEPQ